MLEEKKELKTKDLSLEEEAFLYFIRRGIHSDASLPDMKVDETLCEALFSEGQKQSLLPILYKGIDAALEYFHESEQVLLEELLGKISNADRKRSLGAYHLYHEADAIIRDLEKLGIETVLLKGPSVGVFYEMVEDRKSGDIDLWLKNASAMSDGDFLEAEAYLKNRGYLPDEDMEREYHAGYVNQKGLEVELHIGLTGGFSCDETNQYIEEFTSTLREKSPIRISVLEEYDFPSFYGADLIYYNLLHTLHHFTTKGFGWKFILDWYMMIFELENGEKERLYAMLEQSKLLDFAEMLSLLAVRYLNLPKEKVSFCISKELSEETLSSLAKEVFSSGELGNADGARMLRSGDGSLWSLFLTFHSQMKKNYPDASKVLLIWPLLWAMTLARFIYNNKHIRKVSTKDVLKEARSRGKSTEGIKLFVR